MCSESDSNRRPFPLQGNALPTELSEQALLVSTSRAIVPVSRFFSIFLLLLVCLLDRLYEILIEWQFLHAKEECLEGESYRSEIWFDHVEIQCERETDEQNIPAYTNTKFNEGIPMDLLQKGIILCKQSMILFKEALYLLVRMFIFHVDVSISGE